MAPAYPSPGAYTGYPPQSAFPGMPPDPYNPQGYPASPNIPPNMKALAQNTGAAVAAKAKLLGGLNPLKKFVPHLPPLGRPQKGKPPYNPPPPQPEPPVAGYGQGTSQMPYQQPLSYNPQGMVPPQSAGYGSQPTAGFAPPAFAVKYHHLFKKIHKPNSIRKRSNICDNNYMVVIPNIYALMLEDKRPTAVLLTFDRDLTEIIGMPVVLFSAR